MQIPIKVKVIHDNQQFDHEFPVLLSDTPLTVLLEVLTANHLIDLNQPWDLQPGGHGLSAGGVTWQVRLAGQPIELPASLLRLPQARTAKGLALEVVPLADNASELQREIDRLRQEIQELQKRPAAAASPGRFKDGLADAKKEWERKEQDYQMQLNDQARELNKLRQEAEKRAAATAAAGGDQLSPDERAAIERDLEKRHKEIDAESQKLAQDREDIKREREELQSMEQELRKLETSTARDRAEVSRQRADFQRLQRQLDHQLDSLSRKEELKKALGPVLQLREQIKRSTGA